MCKMYVYINTYAKLHMLLYAYMCVYILCILGARSQLAWKVCQRRALIGQL